jgi:hypothetical protein
MRAAVFFAGAAMADAPQMTSVKLPWADSEDDEITANLAIGNLGHSLLMSLTTERGVHAETLLVAIGAIAGFAAQEAVWARLAKRDLPIDHAATMSREDLSKALHAHGLLVLATTKSGENYNFGDLINGYLVPQKSAPYSYPLSILVNAAAVKAGVKPDELPDYIAMFAHASQTVGTPEYGLSTVDREHRPHLTAREALDRFWPRAKFIFGRTDGPGPAEGRSVPPEHWPLIAAIVASGFVARTKDVLDPRIGLHLLMEAAVTMSKIDRSKVPQTLPEDEQPKPKRPDLRVV